MKARWIGLGIGAALCLAACGDAARPAVVEGSASPADATAGAGIVAAATAPYARAERALAAGRILAPAGDNAIEHYLDARAQPSERVRARAALAELQPYVLIAAEQAIARGDGREAARLQALIARIDSGAPALPRLRASLDALVRAREARDAEGAAAAMPSPAAGASAAAVERIVAATAGTEPVTSPAHAPEPSPAAAPVAATVQAPPPSALPTPPASRGRARPACCRMHNRGIHCRRCARASRGKRRSPSPSSPTAACAMRGCCRRRRPACSRPRRWPSRSAGDSRPRGARTIPAARCISACRPKPPAMADWCPLASAATMAA